MSEERIDSVDILDHLDAGHHVDWTGITSGPVEDVGGMVMLSNLDRDAVQVFAVECTDCDIDFFGEEEAT